MEHWLERSLEFPNVWMTISRNIVEDYGIDKDLDSAEGGTTPSHVIRGALANV